MLTLVKHNNYFKILGCFGHDVIAMIYQTVAIGIIYVAIATYIATYIIPIATGSYKNFRKNINLIDCIRIYVVKAIL